ncbi:sulfurtransferase [Klenkia brasiliensis]|uniref:Thiosulfate/3-mercaptopyruvate sulfurtransferase n=1 Tax=Klenkia brasiliensis TaxID=333142 RepID=A0A1G7SZP2_9ACTN|nr:sulfurtransferase [Klenkia brasiliensis]SDG28441.1 thiosulfate/3-mercaptopyruvate sulfurtransferase [Klenkia brasiliensis]
MTGVLAGPDDVPGAVLLDVRWALGRTDGHERYLAGHLPGAVYVDLDTELAAPPSAAGRHPLPGLADLQAAARRWGIWSGSRVVVYDDGPGTAAARAWWLLRWGRHVDVSILDGGLAGWAGPLETGEVVPQHGDVVLSPGGMPVLTADQAAALPGDGAVLLDARAPERFRGEVEPVDPVAGHVPGAVNLPATDLLADGRFRTDLADHLASLGIGGSPVGVHCGSGVTAAHEVAALASVGVEAALWPGSWSEWVADPSRPVATGP